MTLTLWLSLAVDKDTEVAIIKCNANEISQAAWLREEEGEQGRISHNILFHLHSFTSKYLSNQRGE